MAEIEKIKLMILIYLILHTVGEDIQPMIIIHGGAGTIGKERAEAKREGLVRAIRIAYPLLLTSGNVLDAVESAINEMENLSAFNAGYGSVTTKHGWVEMDAIIINGTDLSAGAVGAIRNIRHPIHVARLVKDRTPHVLLVGEEAKEFALAEGVPYVPNEDLIPPKGSLVDSIGTVGAVAINSKGNIAVGTSTGGISGKLEGRVGDSPIIGAGSFCDDNIAGISGTGFGEGFMKTMVAANVATRVASGENGTLAIENALRDMSDRITGATGGAILITNAGEIEFGFNSEQLAWAYGKGNSVHFGVNRGEHQIIPIKETDT